MGYDLLDSRFWTTVSKWPKIHPLESVASSVSHLSLRGLRSKLGRVITMPDVVTHRYDPTVGVCPNICSLPDFEALRVLDQLRRKCRPTLKAIIWLSAAIRSSGCWSRRLRYSDDISTSGRATSSLAIFPTLRTRLGLPRSSFRSRPCHRMQ